MQEENEIRRDSLEGRFVVMSPGRGARPGGGLMRSKPEAHGKAACRLCPAMIDREQAILEIPDGKGGWWVKAVRNAFPIVDRGFPRAYGSHELVVDTPRGDRPFDAFSDDEADALFSAYASRVGALRRDRSLKYVTVFKNVGRLAGATEPHAHSQIVSTAIAPPFAVGRNKRVGAAFRHTGECPYCALVREESKGPRLVTSTSRAVAIAPFASIFPYEVWILPKRHRHSLTALAPAERRELASLAVRVAGALRKLRLDWNMVTDELFGAEEMHLSLRIFPRGTVWAGMEHETGLITNPILPERAAAEYRESLKTDRSV